VSTKTARATKAEANVVCPSHLEDSTLPRDWEWVSLGNICRTTSGGTPSRKIKEYFEGDIPWVKSGELPDGPVSEIEEYITGEAVKNSSAKQFPKGTLLIALYGATVGKLGVLTQEAATNQAVCAIFPPDDLETKYLFWYLRFVRSDLIAQAIGGAQPNISQGILRNLLIPVAPRYQQKRIVAEIEKQFSRLDEAVANLKRIKANLKRYNAAVLKAAVEGKLTEDWRQQHPNVEPASKLLERILAGRSAKLGKRKEGFLSAEGDPPAESPDSWVACSIDQIAECLDAKRVPVNKAERAKRGGNIPYYGANGQVGVIDDYIFDEALVLVVEDETFAGRTQAFSYLIRGKSWVNNHAHVLRATSAVNVKYLNHALAHYPFTPRTTGSTGRRKLTQKGLMTAPFLLPSLAEQDQIVAEVECRLSLIEELEAAIQTSLTRAERMRQSILSQAFSGRLLTQDLKSIPNAVATFSTAAESPASYGTDSCAER